MTPSATPENYTTLTDVTLFTVGQDFSYDLWNSGATTARIRR